MQRRLAGWHLILALKVPKRQHVGVNGYFNPGQHQLPLLGWCCLKSERCKLVLHSLYRMQDFNGFCRVVPSKRTFWHIGNPVLEHAFRNNKGIQVPGGIRP